MRALLRSHAARRAWSAAFDLGYAELKCLVAMLFAPMFRVRRVGPPPPLPLRGGVILCPNHASYLDPAFVQVLVRRRVVFVMTNDFYARAWGRWFFRLVAAVPIGRGRSARRAMRRTVALVRRGHAVAIFPEGRLTRDGTLARAQRGVGFVARRTGAPVVPVAIVGSRRAWPYGARSPARADVRIGFLPPLRWRPVGPDTSPRKAEQAFADEVLERVARGRERVRSRALSRLGVSRGSPPEGGAAARSSPRGLGAS